MKSSFHSRRAFQALLLASVCTAAFAQTEKPAKPAKATSGPASAAAAWPTKPIRLLIGFPPGSVHYMV